MALALCYRSPRRRATSITEPLQPNRRREYRLAILADMDAPLVSAGFLGRFNDAVVVVAQKDQIP